MTEATLKVISDNVGPLKSYLAYRGGVYVGRIEKDLDGVWRLFDAKGRNLGQCWSYHEGRAELKRLGA